MTRASGFALLLLSLAPSACQRSAYGPSPRTPMLGTQRDYPCRYTLTRPDLDGGLDDAVWASVPWSEPFIDIEGPDKPKPRYKTWFKLLWDDTNLYVGALLEEPHVWATYDRPDMVVYHENDFEVFIDPDGDGERYYEIEVNAKGTIFDLYLHKSYRAGGPAMVQWNCEGIDGGVRVQGTLNQGDDVDRSWSVEMAIPWSCLKPPIDAPEGAGKGAVASVPGIGDVWRLNFSRVQWQVEWVDGAYRKVPGTREDNWTWTPQWAIDMHRPEHWGRVQFTR